MLIRNLLRRPVRTLLTLLGISVGIAAIVSLVALSRGIVANYSDVTSRSDADVMLQAVQGEGQAFQIGNPFDESVLDDIRRLPEVKAASGMLFSMVQLPGAPFFIVYGYAPDGKAIERFRIIEGVSLAENRTRRGGKPIILGTLAADKLHKDVGETVRIEQTTFRVVGLYETGVAMEDSGGVIALRDAQALFDMPRQVVYAGIQLHNPERSAEFEARLERLLPPDVEVAGTKLGGQMREMLGMLDGFAWGVAFIAALVGGVGMMNAMLMSVFERTREIGVLRAVGWASRRVLRMILGESLLLSLLGGLLGLGLGALLTKVAAASSVMAGLTSDSVPLSLAAQALFAALVLGLVGGAYPAWRAARLPPVEALRYDGGAGHGSMPRLLVGGMAVRSLFRQRTRTALTLLGVGIAVLSMVMIGGMVDGSLLAFGRIFGTTEIAVAEKDQPDTSLSTIDERDLKRIEALPEVEYVNGLVFAVVSTPKDPFFVVSARPRRDPLLNPRILREGRLLSGPRECLLGWKGAKQQGKGLGDRITMFGTKFTVVGIISTGSMFEDNGATIELREAQRLLKKPRQVMTMNIKLKDPRQADEMVARLSAEYPHLLFSKSAEFSESLPDMQSTQDMVGAIYAMAAIVGSIALMNTMIMSIYERTREIGVLRALGWSGGMVLRQIIAEGLLLTLLSGLLAILAAIGLVQLLRALPIIGIYREIFLVSPHVVVQALALCVALGVLGGLYPAWRATRFSPVEALRYE